MGDFIEISVVFDEINSEERMTIFLEEIVKSYDVGFSECGILFPKERESESNAVLFHSPLGDKEVGYAKFRTLVETFVRKSSHLKASNRELFEKALDTIAGW